MIQHTRSMLFAVLVTAACGVGPAERTPSIAGPTDGGAVRFDVRRIAAESTECAVTEARCARVDVRWVEAVDGGNEDVRSNINLFLSHDMVSRMRRYVGDDVGAGLDDVERLAGAFLAGHRAFVAEFPEATAEWFIEITATPIFNTPKIATIDIAETAFTGGAHPNSRRRLVSFEVTTGHLVGLGDLTTDIAGLTSLVEQRLRSDLGVGTDDDLAAAGLWLPEEGLTLPENFGVISEGLLFHWDAYEIAPYSMGPIEVTVPAGDLTAILDRDFW
jgi:hypothetical protein